MRVSLILSILLFFSPVFALYNGNPSFPEMPEFGLFLPQGEWLTLKMGYEGDLVFERPLRLVHPRAQLTEHVERITSSYNAGVLTAGVSDRIEVYATLGSFNAQIVQTLMQGAKLRYEVKEQFSWGIGGRAIATYWEDIQLGIEGRYMQTSPSIHAIHLHGMQLRPQGAAMHYAEWQMGLSASYRVRFFIPYVGAKYSHVRAKAFGLKSLTELLPSTQFTLHNAIHIGAFVGMGLMAKRGLVLNAEARFIDEWAGTINLYFAL